MINGTRITIATAATIHLRLFVFIVISPAPWAARAPDWARAAVPDCLGSRIHSNEVDLQLNDILDGDNRPNDRLLDIEVGHIELGPGRSGQGLAIAGGRRLPGHCLGDA